MTVVLPDALAERLGRDSRWIPTILALSLEGYQTRAAAGASELVAFLARNPSREEVLAFRRSEDAQARVRRLLALNSAGQASDEEQAELDELERLEHFVVMLKAGLASGTDAA